MYDALLLEDTKITKVSSSVLFVSNFMDQTDLQKKYTTDDNERRS
jgi:hypothetical protein